MPLKLINDVAKPWDELNALLVERYAFDSDQSDVTRMATSLAVSIKHQADLRGIAPRTPVDTASNENSLMSDVADAGKHGKLKKPKRSNKLSVAACFEYEGTRGFRFIRNAITIEHASAGEHDFMATSLAALQYWMRHIGMALGRELAVRESSVEFFPTAWLTYNPNYCISMSHVRLRTYERHADGAYRLVDPPSMTVEVR